MLLVTKFIFIFLKCIKLFNSENESNHQRICLECLIKILILNIKQDSKNFLSGLTLKHKLLDHLNEGHPNVV